MKTKMVREDKIKLAAKQLADTILVDDFLEDVDEYLAACSCISNVTEEEFKQIVILATVDVLNR